MPPRAVPTGETYSSADPVADLEMHMRALWAIGKQTIPDYVEQLADALDKIISALDSVELNWAGESQREAQDINDRWKTCASALFGTKEKPELGVLSRIGGGIQGAALNYSIVETELVVAWMRYTALLDLMSVRQSPADSGGGGGQHSAPISEV